MFCSRTIVTGKIPWYQYGTGTVPTTGTPRCGPGEWRVAVRRAWDVASCACLVTKVGTAPTRTPTAIGIQLSAEQFPRTYFTTIIQVAGNQDLQAGQGVTLELSIETNPTLEIDTLRINLDQEG
jgi:hypothetical protein